jgi:uncharacterized protein (DUF2344 family)
MKAEDLVKLIQRNLLDGKRVEISVPFYGGFQPISMMTALSEDWVQFTHADLDVVLCVSVPNIGGIRIGADL